MKTREELKDIEEQQKVIERQKVQDEPQLKRLYEWLMNENREPAQTKFTSGWLRNVAKEIEYRIK